MATWSDVKSHSATLSGTTADTGTLTGGWDYIEVLNRATVNTITVTYARSTVGATTPTALADDTEPVMAGERVRFRVPTAKQGESRNVEVKIVGSGDPYTVIGVD